MQIKHKKTFIVIVGLMMLMGIMPSDIYLPALPTITHLFHSNPAAVQMTISVYLLAVATAYFTVGPVIDKFGYKPIALTGITILIIATFACAFAQDLTQLNIARFVQGFAAGIQAIVGRASVSKVFDRKEATRVFGITFPFVALSPALAPVIGGYLTTFFGWRSNFIFIAILAAILLILVTLMYRIPHDHSDLSSIHPVKIIKNYLSILRNKDFLAYLTITSCFYAIYFSYITESPFIFHNLRYSTIQIGQLYIWMSITFILASLITRRAIKTVSAHKIITVGICILTLGVCSLIGMGLYGVTNAAGFIIPISITTAANAIIGTVAIAHAIALFPKQSATAASIFMFFPMAVSGIAAKIVHPLVGISVFGLALFMFTILLISTSAYYTLRD
ncbi:MAG: multidrug effflux MFS transporter [Gammaproteobacteria bacterium]|nr:multidrug effflux MFS transporter [Gammaproteobacteria bacterium]